MDVPGSSCSCLWTTSLAVPEKAGSQAFCICALFSVHSTPASLFHLPVTDTVHLDYTGVHYFFCVHFTYSNGFPDGKLLKCLLTSGTLDCWNLWVHNVIMSRRCRDVPACAPYDDFRGRPGHVGHSCLHGVCPVFAQHWDTQSPLGTVSQLQILSRSTTVGGNLLVKAVLT